MSIVPALVLGILAAGGAWAAGTLTLEGAAAAAVVGSACLAAGWPWALLLLTFFAGSSALSHLGPQRTTLEAAKGGQRDAAQVLANGGIPACAALAHLAGLPGAWETLYAGALAAANADTWATEIGRFSRSAPRLITSGRRVSPGVSGGVTLAGTLGSLAGAAVIAVAGPALGLLPAGSALAIAVAGVIGAIADSVLGATVQERRRCPHCDTFTEQKVHRICGTQTAPAGGVPGVDNDAVNLLAGGAGTVTALVLSLLR